MDSEIVLIITPIFLLLLIIMSSVSSFSEMAMSSCNKNRIKSISISPETSDKNKKKSLKVLMFLDNYNEYISAIVIFNNIINILFSILTTTFFSILFVSVMSPESNPEFWSPIVSFLIMTPIVIIFGEILPKQLGKKFSEKGTMNVSPIISSVNFLMKPLTMILSRLVKEEEVTMLASDEEIQMAISEATVAGVTSSFEEMIIKRSLEIDNILVKDVMIPIEEIVTLDYKITKKELNSVLKKKMHTRFPMINSKGEIKSILSAKKYLIDKLKKEEKPLKEYMINFTKFFDDDNPFHIFEALRNRREKMATIVDSTEKLIGIITIEDIIELMLGSIYDEDDIEEDGVYVLNNTSFIIEPDVNVRYFIETYAKSIKTTIANKEKTIYKWVESIAKKEPLFGEYYIFKNIIIWVREDNSHKDKIIFEIDII